MPARGDSGALIPEARVTVSRANFELSEPLYGGQHYCSGAVRRSPTRNAGLLYYRYISTHFPPRPQPNFASSTNRTDRRMLHLGISVASR